MYQALEIRTLIKVIGGLAIIIFVFLLWYEPPADSVWNWCKHVTQAVGATAAAIIILGNKWVFPHIWRLKFVQAATFPYVAGEWVGTVSSNWPVVKAMMDAYANGAEPKGADTLDISKIPPEKKPIKVTITADLFSIDMRLETLDRYSVSKSLMVKPKRATAVEPARLLYIFENQTDVPVNTDSSNHIGAARLDVTKDGDVLAGTYWTARNWTKGLNTAGRIELRRK
jgi:hypothetical protein